MSPISPTRWIDLTLGQAGGVAGTAVDLLFFPIDTVKTRLQSAQGFIRAGGFRGVYKGIGSVVVGSAPGGMHIHLSALLTFSYNFGIACSCRVLLYIRHAQENPPFAL